MSYLYWVNEMICSTLFHVLKPLADLQPEIFFHAVFRKFWQFRMLAPSGRLAPSPTGNPGSAPETGR